MSIRLRFTLLYTAILALTLTFFGATVYLIQYQATRSSTLESLETFARRVVDMRRLDAEFSNIISRPQPEHLPERLMGVVRVPFRDQEFYFLIRTEEGEILQRSLNLNEEVLPLSDQALGALRHNQTWVESVSIEDDRVLVLHAPVHTPDDRLEIVQVARSVTDQDQILSALRRNLILAGVVVVLAAFAIGWFLSGIVMQPIARITATAQAIGTEQDFGRRVTYRGPNDEVGRLVNTFNAMLGQLQAAYQRLEQAFQMQRRFVADVSHELRTPLTTIRGNIELLRYEPPILPDDQAAVVGDMVEETERLIRLVNDLLLLEHSDAGQHLRLEPLRLKPLIEDACHQAGMLDPGRVIHCENLEDVTVQANRDGLRQVLLILLENAIRHGQGAIKVRTSLQNGNVIICVSDQGPGIPPALADRIFERFYRRDEARSRPGTGLGLSIAKALVQAQSGSIHVQSNVGEGSVFTVVIPKERQDYSPA